MDIRESDIVMLRNPIFGYPDIRPGMTGTVVDMDESAHVEVEIMEKGRVIEVLSCTTDDLIFLGRNGEWVSEEAKIFAIRDVPIPQKSQQSRNEAAIRLLQSFIDEGDEEEQRETWEFLKKALDEDRPSYRKLFP